MKKLNRKGLVGIALAALLLPLEIWAQVEPPRVAILALGGLDRLDQRETAMIRQVDVVQQLRERLIDSRSFWVVMRDQQGIDAVLGERDIAAVDDPAKADVLGLDTADFFLEPTLTFNLVTSYEPLPLLDDIYQRSDRAEVELAVRVFDDVGNIRFEERVQQSIRYEPIQADEEARRRNGARPVEPVHAAMRSLVGSVVGAIVARINPITVLDVQPLGFIIDRGKNNGFDESTRFMVFGQPRVVVNPNTGEERTIPGARIGEAKVVEIYEDVAELSLVSGSNSSVTVGAIVRIVEE
jgi:hypothetical protein